MEIILGQRYKDKVTGFSGVCVKIAQVIYECDEYLIQPDGVNNDGRLIDPYWFKGHRLDFIDPHKVKY